ncbi:MAG: hypothetical protein HYZ74_01090 [Elusimicrobia bacterium]|nr:hypothetical protein [Elusimicrobiota bacterium]
MNTLRAVVALFLLSASAHAAPLDDFQSRVRADLIKPFALDFGGVLGSASAHTGRTLGLPGFWAGVVGSVQTRPDKDDRILTNAGVKTFGLPMLEIGVGLPFKIDVIVHGVNAYGASIYGGGLRYGLYRTDLVDSFMPNLSVSAFGDKANHKHFNAVHLGLNAVATWNLPIVKPFFLAGYDSTKVTVGTALAPGVSGMSETARGSRFSAGVDAHPFPFLSVRGAYTLRHGIPGFDFGLGANF